MWKLTLFAASIAAMTLAKGEIQSGEKLVSSVLRQCGEMQCVKEHVLKYLDNVLNIQSDTARSPKNIDAAILKRLARVLKTHEFRFGLPNMFFDGAEIVYNPRSGLDIASAGTEGRGLLKKKLLLPVLLLLKLKMKALMPIFVAIIGIKALKALILSKLAIAIVLGFVVYQLIGKTGLPMPMSMAPAPAEPPPLYGAPTGPAPSPPPSSYEPGWEPANQGGPYSRIWTSSGGEPQSLAYSAYYPGGDSSSTYRP